MMNTTFYLSYQNRTYEELSEEFKKLYPIAVRAFELIPQMYNRLTFVDKLTHKEAVCKMFEDHKNLPGFSHRNIQRYLPPDNPKKPTRVVTPRHKSSRTELNTEKILSATKSTPIELSNNVNVRKPSVSSSIDYSDCVEHLKRIEELEKALVVISKFTQANTLIGTQVACPIPKEKWYMLTDAIKKSDKTFFIIFDKAGNFVCAEADIDRLSHTSKNNSKN
jgi:hypothetical protein